MTVSIEGTADTNEVLNAIAPREARNLLRTIVQDIASQLAEGAKRLSPDDTGLLDRSTKAKRARGDRNTVSSEVVVERAAYYWRFLEYGDGPDHVEYAMFLKSLESMKSDLERVYLETFARKLTDRLAREGKRRGV